MFGAHVKKGLALLQTTLYPNGNCPQTSCLFRHLRAPVILSNNRTRQGSIETNDGEKNEKGNGVMLVQGNVKEQENLDRALAESLKGAFTCKHCKKSCINMEELQIHLSSCPHEIQSTRSERRTQENYIALDIKVPREAEITGKRKMK